MPSLLFIIILAMAVALGPFAVDTYLPAFPNIAQFMQVSIDRVGLSVSIYIFGLALGQLVGGFLSDRYGRARLMITGLVIFFLSSFLLAFSHTLTQLLLLRFLQALGGGCCGVSVPAIVRDRTQGRETAKLFSLIGLIYIIAPAIAPSIGSLILVIFNWSGIFIFLALYALLLIFFLKRHVFTSPAPLSSRDPSIKKLTMISGFSLVLKNKTARYLILVQAFSFSIMMIFLANASFIYQQWFAVSAFAFSVLFACNIAVMGFLSSINRWLVHRLEPSIILMVAVALQTLAVAALIVIVFLNLNMMFFVPALMVAVGSMGMISPNTQACYLHYFGNNSGTAAALMGAIQLTTAGCMSALSTFIADGSLRPLVLTMGLCAIVCVSSVWKAYTAKY